MSLTKNEVVTMAQEADDTIRSKPFTAEMLSFLERFATLCRAPLVAENAALKQAHEINADTLNAMQVEIDDWKARALKAEQVGEPVAWSHGCNALCANIDLWISHCPHCGKPRPAAPAAREPASAVPVVEQLVEALCELVQSDGLPRTLEQLDASVKKAFAAIAAGQTFINENGK